jgi:hypothetical protein
MAGMLRPTKLSNYPWVVVRIECVLCPRRGIYRLARLAARYGPEQRLDGLLADIAHDCPYWRSNPRKYEPRCGARFVDIERNLPPPDDPGAPVFRQRQPGREDVPKSAPVSAAAPDKVPMLSGWVEPVITIVCDRCGRREPWVAADLVAKHGDMRLVDLRRVLTRDCPQWEAASVYELCRARFEMK